MLLGTTTWAIINFNTTKALIPLIVATILLSMIEGVLVLAIIKAINNKPLDCESHDPPLHLGCTAPSDPAGPLDQALIHPAFRDYSEGSLNSTRNFSLPRERCLDVMPACNAPVIPVPRPFRATGTISRTMSTHRPLPPLPVEPDSPPTPPPHLEEVNDVTILPLRVQKRDSASGETAVKRPEDVEVKSCEKLRPKPAQFDLTPCYPSFMSEAEKIITGLASEQDSEEVDQDITDEAKSKPLESPSTELQTLQTPLHLVTPAIVVQQLTHTTPKSIQCPAATLARTPTIRLVNPYLEIPAMTGYGSRRKK
ncbi:hypothetical protein KCU83_g7517, partial [Aureobasidium melanogenum]